MNRTYTPSVSPLVLLCLIVSFLNSACSPRTLDKSATPQAPIVRNLAVKEIDSLMPSVNPEASTTQSVSVSVTVEKDAIMAQEFVYGADLQYSSFYDADMSLYNQSLAIGHIPARFRIAGDELQLVADNKRLYPSEVNHPEVLISRFKILAQTDKTLTLSSANSGAMLSDIFEGSHTDTHGGLLNPAGKPLRDQWVRSFEFVANGNYILQQTSIILDDEHGTVAEFMESIFPRTTLTPGESFAKTVMDPENPKGGDEAVFEKYRYLAGENIFEGEKKLAYAQHYDISKTARNPEGTIDWYATRNIPDEALEPVKTAIEGWNRYFAKQKGVERDVVLFKGRLPEGIHLGDPRFNVINWDSRLVAGAAYESQASDPQTGKQSHSLIYMPAAWLQIGYDYWSNGQYYENHAQSVAPAALVGHGVARTARLACISDMREVAETAVSGRLSQDEVKEFGARLLRGTLFHEVGHALGLAHNFKGSLSFDRSKAGSIFSTSIMDYNDYEIERGAFPDLHSAEGPELEYDRQILSAIYNKGADVSDKDPSVPVCNDAEADKEEEGVDPLCLRYDLESDPTLSTLTAFDRIELQSKTGDVTLAQALQRVPTLVVTLEALAAVKTKEDLSTLTSKLGASLKGAMKFSILSGKASVSRTVRTNTKSLLEFEDDILPTGYNAVEMRDRAFKGVLKALALSALPDAVIAGLTIAEKTVSDLIALTPYMQALSIDDRNKTIGETIASLHKTVLGFEKDETGGLPKLRAAVLATLARHTDVPYVFGKTEGGETLLDIEASLVGILGDVVAASGDANALRTDSERIAAAKALATYSGRLQGDDALKAAQDALRKQRASARDNKSRERIELILAGLNPSATEN